MAGTVKQALADAGITPDAVAPVAPATDAPATDAPLSSREQAQAQRGAGVRTFLLAPDCEWVPVYDAHGTRIARIAQTMGRNDVRTLTYVPEGGRIAEIPVYAVMDAEAAGAF